MLAQLERLAAAQAITELDLHFARLMVRLGGAPEVGLAACLVSQALGNGDVCLDLREKAGRALFEDSAAGALEAPPLAEWLAALRASPVVGKPGDYRPLILDEEGRLYTYRYWDYERRLALAIRERLAASVPPVDEGRLAEGLARFFPPGEGETPNWQKVAAATAVLKPFCIISGGPGTGKTTTMVRILALLVEQAGAADVSIALTAPTGKAAARMQEAIREAKARLPLAPELRTRIPEDASTIHRLLGGLPDSAYFRHNRDRPLAVDVLVVDEASMVDLALMTKLIEALPPRARLILLGDKDQLASVESGAVLGDLCAGGVGFSETFAAKLREITQEDVAPGTGAPSPLRDAVVLLQHNYRFAADSGIKRASDAVNAGRGEEALSVLSTDTSSARWVPVASLEELQREAVARAVEGYADYLDKVKQGAAPGAVLDAFGRFRVLSALRRGPAGAERLNGLIEEELRRRHAIPGKEPWYAGRPIIVTRNDYNLKLYNGDIGVALPDPAEAERLAVYFRTADGQLRRFATTRLPLHETVYAMTVHKSQGSEFERVLLVLPVQPNPVVTRELIYTGITRAKTAVDVMGEASAFTAAVASPTRRASGLRQRLLDEPRLSVS
ncbi:MAG TPA: exodeoxyribonuclease V subunit alpha [Burkholderiales bacterium]